VIAQKTKTTQLHRILPIFGIAAIEPDFPEKNRSRTIDIITGQLISQPAQKK
jgi:hypothetical protein